MGHQQGRDPGKTRTDAEQRQLLGTAGRDATMQLVSIVLTAGRDEADRRRRVLEHVASQRDPFTWLLDAAIGNAELLLDLGAEFWTDLP